MSSPNPIPDDGVFREALERSDIYAACAKRLGTTRLDAKDTLFAASYGSEKAIERLKLVGIEVLGMHDELSITFLEKK